MSPETEKPEEGVVAHQVLFTVVAADTGEVLRSGECKVEALGKQAKADERLIAGVNLATGSRIALSVEQPVRTQLAELRARLERLEEAQKAALKG